MKTYTWQSIFPIVYKRLKEEKIPANAMVLIQKLKLLNEKYPTLTENHLEAIIEKAKANYQYKATEQ